MDQVKLSQKIIISSIALITLIFFAVISPLKGLSIFTPLLIFIAIVLWVTSIILLIKGFPDRKKENYQKNTLVTIMLIVAFIPLALLYMKLSGHVRTEITVHIKNKSDFVPKNILIYGTGNIFENPDTLKVNSFAIGQELKYIIWPTTKPGRNGYIRMEFDIPDKHITKNIAGEFSVNPYNIQQEWIVTLDKEFFDY